MDFPWQSVPFRLSRCSSSCVMCNSGKSWFQLDSILIGTYPFRFNSDSDLKFTSPNVVVWQRFCESLPDLGSHPSMSVCVSCPDCLMVIPITYGLQLFGGFCGSQLVTKIGRNVFPIIHAISHSYLRNGTLICRTTWYFLDPQGAYFSKIHSNLGCILCTQEPPLGLDYRKWVYSVWRICHLTQSNYPEGSKLMKLLKLRHFLFAC